MQAPRADRHAQADFARPLGDRDEQDVHDTDAANEQRDRRHGGEQKRHDAAAAFGGFDELAQIAHREIVELAGLDAMATDKRVGHLRDRGLDQRLAHRLHINLIGEAGQSRLQIVRVGRGR